MADMKIGKVTHFYDKIGVAIVELDAKLSKGDELLSAHFVEKGDSIMLATTKGQSIRFDEKDVREMGRTAGGVRAIKLTSGDSVVGAGVIRNEDDGIELMVMGANGYGKKTKVKEYKIQNRGGSGIKTASVTTKTGALIAAKIISKEHSEIVAISKKGQVIRTGLENIPSLGRQTQGVRIMKLRTGDSLASLVRF